MNAWLPRIVILAIYGVVLGIPLALRPPAATFTGSRLVVLTPHNEHIRREFADSFRDWHRTRYGVPVEIDWRKVGGSSDIVRLLDAQYRRLAQFGLEDEGTGYDVVFGGGDYLFDKQLKRGVTVLDNTGASRTVSITQPINLPDDVLKSALPSSRIADRPLYDLDGHWYGAALSSFGIVYNREVLDMLDVPEPTTWEDLTNPRLFGWVALADASHSGSIRATYEAIVQRHGWEQGWKTLREICANARYFSAEAQQVPVDVSNGEVAAGMCVDFFGRAQAARIGSHRMGYVSPKGMTIVNADPIAVLRGAPHREWAERFIMFVLSDEGQGLWNFAPGDPLGPARNELRRMPVRPDFYERFADRLIEKENPYSIASPMPPDTPSYFDVIPVVLHAMVVDIRGDLADAWQAVSSETDPARREAMRAMFHALPFDQAQLSEAPKRWRSTPATRTEDRLQWTSFFRAQYRKVVDASRGDIRSR